MLAELAIAFVALKGPSDQVIWVNPATIISLRALREQHKDHITSETNCVLQTVDGKTINVVNECDEVLQRFGGPQSWKGEVK